MRKYRQGKVLMNLALSFKTSIREVNRCGEISFFVIRVIQRFSQYF